ncbi:acyl-CoA-binding protein [Zunongwangia sp.]|uniref:acyl-CoA-binding protein n=1 Tax=Zunongwangia sp. TaxID=1965325 RepID=UPI003AA867FE
MSKETEERFDKAYQIASNTKKKFAPDVLLQFYAHYKKATERNGFYIPVNENIDLRSAFKMNALLQVKNLSKTEAQQRYIELVEKYIEKVPE